MTNAVGVDVGGTAIKAVLVDADGTVLADHGCAASRPDPAGRDTAAAIVGCVRHLAGGQRLPVGLTSPGPVDERSGVVIDSVNLDRKNVPIRDLVEALLGLPVGFGHGVRAGGLAEMSALGRVDSEAVTAFVAIGTGLAAAIFIGQRALDAHGWAGEVGQIVFPAGPHAGKRIEEVASAADSPDRGSCCSSPPASGWPRLPGVPLPPILPATHGHHAGAMGAALLGRQRVESLPLEPALGAVGG